MNDDFAHTLGLAREKLRPAERPSSRPLAALAAAAFFCISALTFAVVAVIAPATEKTPAARTGVQ